MAKEVKRGLLLYGALLVFVTLIVMFRWSPVVDAQSQGNHYPMGLYLNECADKTAADPITVDDCNVVRFNGAATPVQTINNCTEAQRGRVLHIVCDGDATVFDDGGGNLNLARDFTCSANDTLTISCTKNAADAYEWLEIGRGAHLYSSDGSPADMEVARMDGTSGGIVEGSLCTVNDAGLLDCPKFSLTDADSSFPGPALLEHVDRATFFVPYSGLATTSGDKSQFYICPTSNYVNCAAGPLGATYPQGFLTYFVIYEKSPTDSSVNFAQKVAGVQGLDITGNSVYTGDITASGTVKALDLEFTAGQTITTGSGAPTVTVPPCNSATTGSMYLRDDNPTGTAAYNCEYNGTTYEWKAQVSVALQEQPLAITVWDPEARDVEIEFTPFNMDLTEMNCVATGGAAPSVEFNLQSAATRNGTATEHFATFDCDNIAGETNSTFADADLDVNRWVWVEIESVVDATNFHVSFEFDRE